MDLHFEPERLRRPLTWRGDFSSACAVERGLALQASQGTRAAAALMSSQGIAIGVAMRVLVQGVRRNARPQSMFGLRTYISPPPLIYRHSHY